MKLVPTAHPAPRTPLARNKPSFVDRFGPSQSRRPSGQATRDSELVSENSLENVLPFGALRRTTTADGLACCLKTVSVALRSVGRSTKIQTGSRSTPCDVGPLGASDWPAPLSQLPAPCRRSCRDCSPVALLAPWWNGRWKTLAKKKSNEILYSLYSKFMGLWRGSDATIFYAGRSFEQNMYVQRTI